MSFSSTSQSHIGPYMDRLKDPVDMFVFNVLKNKGIYIKKNFDLHF